MMIVNEHDDGDYFARGAAGLLVHEPVANEVAQRFAAISVSSAFDVLVEGGKKRFFQRNADAGEFGHRLSGQDMSR